MTFKNFNQAIQKQFEEMQKHRLFRLNVSGQQIWDTYISGFSPEENPIFRDPQSSTHQCNNDMNFIRRYGNIVAINENFEIVTMFDISNNVAGTNYENTIAAIQKLLRSPNVKVTNVFFETFEELKSLPYESCNKSQAVFQLGHQKTLKKYTQEEADKFGVVNTQDIYTFYHFHTFLNKEFVDQSGKSVESIMGDYRDAKNIFQRGLEEISLDTLKLVKDLITQGSLLNGDSYLGKLKMFIEFKKEWENIPSNLRNNWYWVKSYGLPFAKFRNELIGTLCVELTEGKELNSACLDWNKRADPANYMKASAPITKRQIQEAEKFISENDYLESFNRRFATLDDINVNEIKHMNINQEAEKPVGLFAGVQPTKSTQHKRAEFDGVEEVSIEKFMKDILPTCTGVELFLENRLENNLVTLTTAASNSKPIFKWDNNFSWSYKGNLTGKSELKEQVKNKGGVVDGVLRFSISWGDNDGDHSDLDAWCIQPSKERIGYSEGFRADTGNKFSSCGGQLDLDDRGYSSNVKVENIYFKSLSQLQQGEYKFYVNQYSASNSKGFKAQIEFNGEIFDYFYNTRVTGNVNVATITFRNGQFIIEHHLPEVNQSKELWGMESGKFHKVNLVCLSPNFWGNNNVGNKHYFFMLDGCHSDTPMRSFHNENLNGDLLQHRKVMEVLATVRQLEPAKKQLAGVGFNATVRDNVILKLSGTHKRTVKLII